jgi:hypothetical protein
MRQRAKEGSRNVEESVGRSRRIKNDKTMMEPDPFDRRPYKESVSDTCPFLFSPSRTNGDTSHKAGQSADRYGSPPGRFDERGDDDD